MTSLLHDALQLKHDLTALLKTEESVVASLEDANYFRAWVKKQKAPPPPHIESPRTKEIAPPPPIAPSPPRESSSAPPCNIATKPDEPLLGKHSLKSLMNTIAPDLLLIDEIPSDRLAKKLSQRWKTQNQIAPLLVLHHIEPPEQKSLLASIATALDVYFGPASFVAAEPIEQDKQWDLLLATPHLKMIFLCDYTLWQLKDLMRHYKETPTQGLRTLGQVPLFLFPDMSLYLKDPLLKRSLWKALYTNNSKI